MKGVVFSAGDVQHYESGAIRGGKSLKFIETWSLHRGVTGVEEDLANGALGSRVLDGHQDLGFLTES